MRSPTGRSPEGPALQNIPIRTELGRQVREAFAPRCMPCAVVDYTKLERVIMSDNLKTALLSAPESQLDAKMKPLIEKWGEPPTAIQLLEVLDHCIHGALASSLVVKLLQLLYDDTLKAEGTTHEEVVKLATWRDGQ